MLTVASLRSIGFTELSDCPFQRHSQKLLRFHRELHRQFLEHLAAKPVHDHRYGILGGDPALLAVEELVFADL
jgi:hypothetical protein